MKNMENYNNNGGKFQPRNNNMSNNNMGNNNVRPEVVNDRISCATTAPCTGKQNLISVAAEKVMGQPVKSAVTILGGAAFIAVTTSVVRNIRNNGIHGKWTWMGSKSEEKKPAAEQPAAAAAEEGK